MDAKEFSADLLAELERSANEPWPEFGKVYNSTEGGFFECKTEPISVLAVRRASVPVTFLVDIDDESRVVGAKFPNKVTPQPLPSPDFEAAVEAAIHELPLNFGVDPNAPGATKESVDAAMKDVYDEARGILARRFAPFALAHDAEFVEAARVIATEWKKFTTGKVAKVAATDKAAETIRRKLAEKEGQP